MTIYGINPTSEALKAATVSEVWVSGRRDGRLAHLVELARRAGVPVRHVQPPELDRLARGGVHQGIVARVTGPTEYTLSDLLTIRSGPPLIMVLDGVEDPQNFGALVRTADAVGVDRTGRADRHLPSALPLKCGTGLRATESSPSSRAESMSLGASGRN